MTASTVYGSRKQTDGAYGSAQIKYILFLLSGSQCGNVGCRINLYLKYHSMSDTIKKKRGDGRFMKEDTIKDMRTESGMTQQEFADYFGIPKRNIENWEEGSRNVQEYWLRLIRYKLEMEKLISKREE